MPVAIETTNFNLPGQVGDVYHGKVGDVYALEHEAGDLLAVVRTDRISAFDVVFDEPIPSKGQVLNEMSASLLVATRQAAPNWLIESPDPNVSIGYKAKPIKVEMIVRGYLLGSAARNYEAGMRDLCGNPLPNGMSEFDIFSTPLVTPTTKASEGHDEDITPKEIVEQGLVSGPAYEIMHYMSQALFAKGQSMARERGLVLADTKYEFGFSEADGKLMVIDEVHNPDTSRYYPATEMDAYLKGETRVKPVRMSKEFFREWLIEQGFMGEPGQTPPPLPPELVEEVRSTYIDLYERMLGRPFIPAEANSQAQRLEQIADSIEHSLGSLTLA
jgi:phosphoribosylaminoimidazole-succinocarboxamide synthase